MSQTPTIQRLKTRPQFLAAAKGRSEARGAVVVQGLPRNDDDASVRVGFTATRKVGGAVVRNRAKRRLREAARLLLPRLASPGWDYVLIARMGAAERAWDRLLDDVEQALTRLATPRPQGDGLGRAGPLNKPDAKPDPTGQDR